MIKQAVVETEKQLKTVLLRPDVKDIIMSVDSFSDDDIAYFSKKICDTEKNCMLRLERITRKEAPSYDKYISNENIKGFLVENTDSFYRIKDVKDKIIELDYTMNIWNTEAKKAYGDFQFTYPIELSAYDMKKLHMDTIVVYSDLPVMVSANCPFKTKGECEKKQKTSYFIDRLNIKVKYKSYCKYCYSKIFNPDFLYIFDILKTDRDLKELKYRKIRYEFSLVDDEDRINDILDGNIDTSEKSMEKFTRGHAKKSIQ